MITKHQTESAVSKQLGAALVMAVTLLGFGCAVTKPVVKKSPEERYKFVAENLGKMVTGGRITQVRWANDESSFTFTRGDKKYVFDLNDRSTKQITATEETNSVATARPRGNRSSQPARGRQRDRVTSPDGKWIAMCKDWNVVLEPVKKDENEESESGASPESAEHEKPEPIHVTTDGQRKFRYGTASWVYGEELDQREAMWWSPDSRKLVFYEFDERAVPDHYITDGLIDLHTKVLTEGYPKPGEPNPIANLLVYDLETKATTRIETPEDDQATEWYTYDVQFTPTAKDESSPQLLFHRTNRRQNVLHLVAADISTGKTRIVLTETQEAWQDNSPPMRFLEDGHRFIWTTEKTGWKQLELHDLNGPPDQFITLTHGEYPVSSIVRVDEKAGQIFYTAFSSLNPLNAQLHRVNMDGTGQVRLTREPLNHTITMSPSGKWFITEYEAVGVPPTTALYDSEGHRIATLAESDSSQFKKLGMSMPELFTFKADDGKTDLYGVLYKPSNFNASEKYPLLIDVYGGPLSQGVRNRFSPGRPECEYGFLVAAIDNRGTVGRGKAFETATYMKLGQVDIKDQADGVRFLTKRGYVDANHVGIAGHSYGGYMSAMAVLKYPDVFQVACAGGTVTDWRNYDTIYTERFMRTPEENPEGYDAGSCLKYVNQLQGKLLLLHGMVDDNVHTNNVWQLIDALQKANKPFEMMFYPDAGHSLGGRANAAKWDFLRKNLQPH